MSLNNYNLRQFILNDAKLRLDMKEGRYKNLINEDLSGLDLRNWNLRGADLRGANLQDSDLSEADLRGANLFNSNLTNIKLEDADLEGSAVNEDFKSLLSKYSIKNFESIDWINY